MLSFRHEKLMNSGPFYWSENTGEDQFSIFFFIGSRWCLVWLELRFFFEMSIKYLSKSVKHFLYSLESIRYLLDLFFSLVILAISIYSFIHSFKKKFTLFLALSNGFRSFKLSSPLSFISLTIYSTHSLREFTNNVPSLTSLP